jgi:hypothetical protein
LPYDISKNSELYLVKSYVRASLGLGATDVNYNSSSFVNTVKTVVKPENNRFSFYFHKDMNILRFGREENYFRSAPFTVFKNRAVFNTDSITDFTASGANIPKNQWQIKISRITFNKPSTDIAFNQDSSQKVI